MKRLFSYLIICLALQFNITPLFCEPLKTFNTKYTVLHYADDKDLSDFFWHVGGARFDLPTDTALASNRIDRIVERVETILDMRPKNFKVKIYLERKSPPSERVAYYDHKSGAIYVQVDHATDGVVAHEIAHAIIDRFFDPVVPDRVREILTQYVDKYLWSDY